MEGRTGRLFDLTAGHDQRKLHFDDCDKEQSKAPIGAEPRKDDGSSAYDEEFYTFADVRRICMFSLAPDELEKYGQKRVGPARAVQEEEKHGLNQEERWNYRTLEKDSQKVQLVARIGSLRSSASALESTTDNLGEQMQQLKGLANAPEDTFARCEATLLPNTNATKKITPDPALTVEEHLEANPSPMTKTISMKMTKTISFKEATSDGEFLLSSCSGHVATTEHASQPRFARPTDVLRLRNRRLREPSGSSVNAVALTLLDGDFFMVTGSDDAIAKIWLVSTGDLLHLLRGHERGVLTVAFSSPGGNGEILVATGSADSTAKIWSLSSGGLLHTLRGHDGWVRSVAFSPQLHSNRFWLVTGSDNGSEADRTGAAKLWRVNASTGEWRHSFDIHVVTCTAFSPPIASGMVLFAIASVEDPAESTTAQSKTQLWDASNTELLSTFRGHTDNITAVAFGPISDTSKMDILDCNFDELFMATCSWDKTAKVWKAQSGELLHTLVGHQDVVSSVFFGPRCLDGTMLLATGSWDRTAKLWSVPAGMLLHTFEDHEDWLNSVVLQCSSKEQALLATGSRDKSVTIYCINLYQHTKPVLRKFTASEFCACCGWQCTLL